MKSRTFHAIGPVDPSRVFEEHKQEEQESTHTLVHGRRHDDFERVFCPHNPHGGGLRRRAHKGCE